MISTVHTTCVASPVRASCHPAVTTESAHRISHEKNIRPSGVPGTQPPTAASKPDKAGGDECDIVASVPAIRRPERSIVRGISTFSVSTASAPGRTRTGNLRIRRPMLYPLSYGGVREAPHQPTPSTRRPHPRRGGRPEAVINTRKRSREDHIAMTRTHRSERANGSAQPRRSRLTLLSTITAIRP